MKKISLVTSILFYCLGCFAQDFVNESNMHPVKLSDVVKAHQLTTNVADDDDAILNNGKKIVTEGHDYHFGRWLWYWNQHIDENGFLVSPMKTYQEWNNYINKKAQAKTTASVSNANWNFEGPTSSAGGYEGLGRINAIEFHPTDVNTYWVCSAGGGIWKTINDGASWTSLTNNLAVLGTSDIDANPINPNTLYLCTGDRDHGDTYSIGVLKSTNAGQTWDTTGLVWSTSKLRLTNCLVINKADTNSLLLAASDSMYKSNNGGATWKGVKAGNFKQVLYHPTDTNIVYATTYKTSTADAHIFRSANGGQTWTQITSFSGRRRITLAVSPANVRIVKAIVANSSGGLDAIYSSRDTGKTFTNIYAPSGCSKDILSGDVVASATSITKCGAQGWYDLSIAISPVDTNKVYIGGVNSWYSSNGGYAWNILNQWRSALSNVAVVHADKHMLKFNPLAPTKLFECSDGGIYKVTNPLPTAAWTDISNGMATTQFYRNAVAGNATYVIGGAQDNGTKGLQNASWVSVNGGDGMDCQIDYADSNTFYTAVQYGKIYRTDLSGQNDITAVPMDGGWITPYILSPFDNNQIIAGYKNIYMSPDQGNNWYQVTSDSLDYTKFIYRLAMTPASASTIYAVTDPSYNNSSSTNPIYYTHSFSPSSVQASNTIVFSTINCPYVGNISDIKVDRKDKDHFWVTFSGYNTNKVAEYKSGIWSQLNNNLPNIPVLCMEIDTSNDIMYVGTDVGVFYMDSSTKPNWQVFNDKMPSIQVTDLGLNYTTKQIWASTFGRGMWSSPRQTYVPDTTNNGSRVANILNTSSAFTIYPNPNNGKFTARTFSKQLLNTAVGIAIVDNAGRLVLKQNGEFDAAGRLNINAETLPKGIYTIEMTVTDKLIGRQKMVIN